MARLVFGPETDPLHRFMVRSTDPGLGQIIAWRTGADGFDVTQRAEDGTETETVVPYPPLP